ncbi:MAG: hypothetical protein IKK84_03875 [Clostridia bacterium]|nr:hypothetical protein [Clostridia bacterium]MBR6641593.1 hypothetical protein [Clostridia bacterium]
MHVKVMLRVKRDNKEQIAKELFSFTADCVPRRGDLIDFVSHATYKVVEVIFCAGHVILEVEEYNNPTNPPLSKCPLY